MSSSFLFFFLIYKVQMNRRKDIYLLPFLYLYLYDLVAARERERERERAREAGVIQYCEEIIVMRTRANQTYLTFFLLFFLEHFYTIIPSFIDIMEYSRTQLNHSLYLGFTITSLCIYVMIYHLWNLGASLHHS